MFLASCCAVDESDFWQEQHSLPECDRYFDDLPQDPLPWKLSDTPENMPALLRAPPEIIDLKGKHTKWLMRVGPTAEQVPKPLPFGSLRANFDMS